MDWGWIGDGLGMDWIFIKDVAFGMCYWGCFGDELEINWR